MRLFAAAAARLPRFVPFRNMPDKGNYPKAKNLTMPCLVYATRANRDILCRIASPC
jgi:hypothetical protein